MDREPIVPFFDSVLWPSFSFLERQLANEGFHFGESYKDYESQVARTSHVLTLAAFETPPAGYENLYRCAKASLEICSKTRPTPSECLGSLAQISDTVFVGPSQRKLLELLGRVEPEIRVIAGYRSPAYQALLFASRFLMGTLLDNSRRYTAAPPGWSDHNLIDGALDFEDTSGLLRGLLRIVDQLPLTLCQPYLCDSHVAYEPWHWRTLQSNNGTRHGTTAVGALVNGAAHLSKAMESMREQGQLSETCSPEFIFAMGISASGHSACMGSRQRTMRSSVADALEAVGSGWSVKYLSVPTGYTPSFDNQIQPQDVGRCTFRIRPRNGGDAAYLTGAACVFHKKLRPHQVLEELSAKANCVPSVKYRVEKSRSTDLLVLPCSHAVPASYGLPASPFERNEEVPQLVFSDYCKWLAHGSRKGVPLYSSQDYGRTSIAHCDPTRYALVLSFLARYSTLLSEVMQPSISRLASTIISGELGRAYLRGEVSSADPVPEATIVFMAQSLSQLGQHEELRRLWESQFERMKAYVGAVVASETDPNGWLFIGHFCQLASESSAISPQEFLNVGLGPSEISRLISRSRLSLLHACACAQMIRYLVQYHADHDGHAPARWAEELLSRLLAAEPAGVEEEDGAFGGLESFQSSLPAEALLHLQQIVALSEGDNNLIFERIERAVKFLRRLQFQPGSGMITNHPDALEGAVHYSLIDHHYRIDYGAHAATVAGELWKRRETDYAGIKSRTGV